MIFTNFKQIIFIVSIIFAIAYGRNFGPYDNIFKWNNSYYGNISYIDDDDDAKELLFDMEYTSPTPLSSDLFAWHYKNTYGSFPIDSLPTSFDGSWLIKDSTLYLTNLKICRSNAPCLEVPLNIFWPDSLENGMVKATWFNSTERLIKIDSATRAIPKKELFEKVNETTFLPHFIESEEYIVVFKNGKISSYGKAFRNDSLSELITDSTYEALNDFDDGYSPIYKDFDRLCSNNPKPNRDSCSKAIEDLMKAYDKQDSIDKEREAYKKLHPPKYKPKPEKFQPYLNILSCFSYNQSNLDSCLNATNKIGIEIPNLQKYKSKNESSKKILNFY